MGQESSYSSIAPWAILTTPHGEVVFADLPGNLHTRISLLIREFLRFYSKNKCPNSSLSFLRLANKSVCLYAWRVCRPVAFHPVVSSEVSCWEPDPKFREKPLKHWMNNIRNIFFWPEKSIVISCEIRASSFMFFCTWPRLQRLWTQSPTAMWTNPTLPTPILWGWSPRPPNHFLSKWSNCWSPLRLLNDIQMKCFHVKNHWPQNCNVKTQQTDAISQNWTSVAEQPLHSEKSLPKLNFWVIFEGTGGFRHFHR